MGPDLIAIEHFQLCLCTDSLADCLRQRALARAGQPGEPKNESPRRRNRLAVREGLGDQSHFAKRDAVLRATQMWLSRGFCQADQRLRGKQRLNCGVLSWVGRL